MNLRMMREAVERIESPPTKGKTKSELRIGDILKRKSNGEYCKLDGFYEGSDTLPCYYFKTKFGGFGVHNNCISNFFVYNYNEFNIYADMKGGHLE